jgi:hypothetical protein
LGCPRDGLSRNKMLFFRLKSLGAWGFSKRPSLFYLLILLYCTIFFLFLLYSSLLIISLFVVEKTPRKFQFGKKSAKVYHSLYSSTEQLQVAL